MRNASHIETERRIPMFPGVIAVRYKQDGRVFHEISYQHNRIATMHRGILVFKASINKTSWCTSIDRAMKMVYTYCTKKPKVYRFKDVEGLYAQRHGMYESAYEIFTDSGVRIAYLDPWGSLLMEHIGIGKQAEVRDKLNLRNAMRLMYLKTLKPF